MHLGKTTCALLTTALLVALAPAASAEHSVCTTIDFRDTTCAAAGSVDYGSCEGANGGQATTVTVYRFAGDGSFGFTSVSAGCSAYTYEWDGQTWSSESDSVTVWSYQTDGETQESTFVGWSSYESDGPWGASEGCSMWVYHEAIQESTGCPAGAPPRVPPALP